MLQKYENIPNNLLLIIKYIYIISNLLIFSDKKFFNIVEKTQCLLYLCHRNQPQNE